ncbi:MAG TPA: hypothetical protein VIO38_07830, partial [Rariglobus sp.]
WSIHPYLHSVPGCFRGFTGHCSANRRALPQLAPCANGLSYVRLQSTATAADPHGLLLEVIEKTPV